LVEIGLEDKSESSSIFHLGMRKKELQLRTVELQTLRGHFRERPRALHLSPGKSLRPNLMESDCNSPKTHLNVIFTRPSIQQERRRESHNPHEPALRKNHYVFWWGLYNADDSFREQAK
jgi:hypothetical protein